MNSVQTPYITVWGTVVTKLFKTSCDHTFDHRLFIKDWVGESTQEIFKIPLHAKGGKNRHKNDTDTLYIASKNWRAH